MSRFSRPSLLRIAGELLILGGVFFIWRVYVKSDIIFATRLPSGALFISESADHPELMHLREQEGIGTIASGYTTDLDKLTAINLWASKQFPPGSPFPHYPAWNARLILDQVRRGKTGGFCTQYALVFGQASQSLGFAVRYFDLASKTDLNGHFLTEVFVPSERKWIAFDPSRGIRYTTSIGTPLSVFELHQIAIGAGPGPVYELPGHQRISPETLALFLNFDYYLRNNFLSVPTHVAVKSSSHGQQLFFSPNRLRYMDPVSATIPAFGDSFTSSDPRDFNFQFDMRKREERTCRTVPAFYKVLSTEPAGTIFRIRIPHFVLTRLIESLFDDPSYFPLKEQLHFYVKPVSAR